MIEELPIAAAVLPLTLAQIPSSTPNGLGNFLVDGAAILAIVVLVLKLWETIAGKFAQKEIPPREYVTAAACAEKHRDVSIAADTAARASVAAAQAAQAAASAHTRIESVFGEIKSVRLETKEDVRGINDRVSEILTEIGTLHGKIDPGSRRRG